MKGADEKRLDELERELVESVGDAALTIVWLVFVYASTLGCLLWDAYALTLLWTWHVAPWLQWPAPADLGNAVGVVVVANLLTHQLPAELTKRTRLETLKRYAFVCMMTAAMLFFGWVARWV
jgi:hypothetical protein